MILQTKSGRPLHPVGIGTWAIANRIDPENAGSKYKGVEPVHGNEEQEIEALRYSMSKGQNHLDCAELYGGFYTDEVVGRAITTVQREDLYLADKLWKTSLGKGKVRPIVEQMLTKLGTDYLDLLCIHSPWPGWQEAVPQIDALIAEGIVRQFGVSNFSLVQMQESIALAQHPVAANQMKYNVLYQDEVHSEFHAFCRENAIQIVAYQPIKRQEVLADKTVQAIANTHNATPAQVALSWLIQQGTLPIPKSTTKAHIDENFQATDVHLTKEEMTRLAQL